MLLVCLEDLGLPRGAPLPRELRGLEAQMTMLCRGVRCHVRLLWPGPVQNVREILYRVPPVVDQNLAVVPTEDEVCDRIAKLSCSISKGRTSVSLVRDIFFSV